MKKKIIELMKGKKHMGTNSWETYESMQSKLTTKQYILFWLVNAQEAVFIDKNNIIQTPMSERVFDTIDSEIFNTI